MFNVTIIKLRDIVKIVIILIAIYVLSRFIFKNISIKNYLNQSISFNTSDFIKLGINTESNIIKYIAKQETNENGEKTEEIEEDTDMISIKSILQVGSNVFRTKGLDKDLGQDENANLAENTGESSVKETAQTSEIATDAPTQVVTKNPIAETFNKEYNGIKIRNETSFELTDEILNSDNLNIDTKNIIIFHTHTCESYTQSQNYQYTSSRKLSYNRPKLFGCKSRG